MRTGFIGAGKVGITLGAYFRSGGIKISGYYSRSERSAQKAGALTSSTVFKNMGDLLLNSDFIYITTPDDAVNEVWNEISRYHIEGKYIISTSGSLTSDVFYGKEVTGAYCFTVHPMYAFSSDNGDFKGLESCCFTIEGDMRRIDFVRDLFKKSGNTTFEINAKDKPLYHLANVFASNMVLALLSMGTDLMSESGIDKDEFLKAIIPLALENIRNVGEKGLVNALTGPVERNDTGTVKKHVENMPGGYINIYAALSSELIKLAVLKNRDRDYSRISEYIGELLSGGEYFG